MNQHGSMAQKTWVCLCDPSDVRNIAGTIRAVANLRLAGLKVVSHTMPDREALYHLSSGALSHIQYAHYTHLDEAISHASMVIGTSRRTHHALSPPCLSSMQLPSYILNSEHPHILFGNERVGLRTHELDVCQAIIEIPTNPQFPSMNLSHAVVAIGYEIARASISQSSPKDVQNLSEDLRATPQATEAFFKRVREIVEKVGYPKGRTPESFIKRLRKLLRRANPDAGEYGLLLGSFKALNRLHTQLSSHSDTSHEPQINHERSERSTPLQLPRSHRHKERG